GFGVGVAVELVADFAPQCGGGHGGCDRSVGGGCFGGGCRRGGAGCGVDGGNRCGGGRGTRVGCLDDGEFGGQAEKVGQRQEPSPTVGVGDAVFDGESQVEGVVDFAQVDQRPEGGGAQ